MKTEDVQMEDAQPTRPTLIQVSLYFLRLGCTGFGGPVALANYMRKDLVDKFAWINGQEYDEGLAIATACPGPLAYQLGVYCGYLTHGVAGAMAIAVAFALGPFVIVTVTGRQLLPVRWALMTNRRQECHTYGTHCC